MNVGTRPGRDVGERSGWRAVAVPSEHGGWGLTLEPVLLGLLVAWSVAGAAIGIAALTAFLLRTPAKLVAVDLRRGRWLDRSRLALRIAIVETVILASGVAAAILSGGWSWLVPVAMASPLIAIELSYDIRSKGRRLVPELCGAVGMAAVSAAIVVAVGRSTGLAAGVWLVLAARAIGAIPFVRVQIFRLRRGEGPVWQSDLSQTVAVVVAVTGAVVDRRFVAGLVGVAALALLQSVWVRRPPLPAKILGLREMTMGLALVAITAVGAAW